MRLFYRSKKGASGIVYEQAGPTTFCCTEMCRNWNNLIGFGVKGHARSTSREVNICTALPQANGGTVLVVTEIQFCPWCAEAVETCRVKR